MARQRFGCKKHLHQVPHLVQMRVLLTLNPPVFAGGITTSIFAACVCVQSGFSSEVVGARSGIPSASKDKWILLLSPVVSLLSQILPLARLACG
jgi:hypothetical protein